MGQLIKGKLVADAISEGLKGDIKELKTRGISPKLAIVRVGNNPGDIAYESGALKRCRSLEISAEVKQYPENISQWEFTAELERLNKDSSINGILVLRPLPRQLDESEIKYVITPEKDVDCFNPLNVAKVMEKDEAGFAPCTPSAVIEMLRFYHVPLKGKRVVVVGRSMVVGKPAAMLLLNENATVTICHSQTRDLPNVCSEADILVTGIGRAKMINSNYLKPGAVVIDVGINQDENGNMCGDADTDHCISKASMITPVPGGVGSVTTSILAKHVVKACMQQNNI